MQLAVCIVSSGIFDTTRPGFPSEVISKPRLSSNLKSGILDLSEKKSDSTSSMQSQKKSSGNYSGNISSLNVFTAADPELKLEAVDTPMKEVEAEGKDEDEDGLNEADVVSKMHDLKTQINKLEIRLTEIETEKEREYILSIQPITTPPPSPQVEHQLRSREMAYLHSSPSHANEEITSMKNNIRSAQDDLPERIMKTNHHKVFKDESVSQARKYLPEKPINRFSQYSFYRSNIDRHNKFMKTLILNNLKKNRREVFERGKALQVKYKVLYDSWVERCKRLDEEYEAQDVASSQHKESDGEEHSRVTSEDGILFGRRCGRASGHNADTVRSEAEFMEILATLEWENSRDPKNRAKLTSAKIPDMILDPTEREARFVDSNNIIVDPSIAFERLSADGVDVFSVEEHKAFCEGYKLYPKQFGLIAKHMNFVKSSEECVLHYYLTKKQVDYKTIGIVRSRRNAGSRKGRRRARGGANLTTPKVKQSVLLESPGADLEDEEAIDEQQNEQKDKDRTSAVTDSEIAALLEFGASGRPRRAAAPVFGVTEKEKAVSEPPKKRGKPGPKSGKGIKAAASSSEASLVAAEPSSLYSPCY